MCSILPSPLRARPLTERLGYERIVQGKSYTVTLPTEIAPGDYLIRHEIIALQRAATLGLAEFYPSCTQVRVGGSGTGVGSPTVHFPGAYKEDDPGLYTPDVRPLCFS